jgi:hypothetical protein
VNGVVDAAGETPAAGLAARGGGLTAPGLTVLALAAESQVPVGDGAARALATPLLGEDDGESEIVHPNLPSLDAFRIARIGVDAPV